MRDTSVTSRVTEAEMILRDDIAHHRKFLVADEILGGNGGAAQALAVWIAAIGYARRYKTNGFVERDYVRDKCVTLGGTKVADVLCQKRIKLFHRAKGGYVVHDFGKHNGTSDKQQYQRKLAAARKRKQRAKQAVENSQGTSPVTRDRVRDSRARANEKKKEVRTEPDARGTSKVPGSGEQRCTSNNENSGADAATPTQTTQHRSSPHSRRLSREPAADGNYAVIEKLAHNVLEEFGTDNPESPDVVEALKRRCAQLAITYATDPSLVRRALVSAAMQRTLIPVRPSPSTISHLARDLRSAPTVAALNTKLKALAARSVQRR